MGGEVEPAVVSPSGKAILAGGYGAALLVECTMLPDGGVELRGCQREGGSGNLAADALLLSACSLVAGGDGGAAVFQRSDAAVVDGDNLLVVSAVCGESGDIVGVSVAEDGLELDVACASCEQWRCVVGKFELLERE